MVVILRVMIPDFNHVQIPTGQEVPSMESLTTRLVCVPILTNRNFHDSVESSSMLSTFGKGGCDNRGGRSSPIVFLMVLF